MRLTVAVRNCAQAAVDKEEAIALSFIGTHLVTEVTEGEFVSLLEPDRIRRRSGGHAARATAASRCWPGRPATVA